MARRGDRVRIEVLGPIRVVDDGDDITPDGVLQRRLLALLVLRRGHVVPADAAIDALWPAAPPQEPAAALQNHLSRLRRRLPDGLIESIGSGYRLDPTTIELDIDRLADLVSEASSPDAATIVAIDELLDRWAGPAYPELDETDDGRAEAIRLEELRLRAREVRAEARLALGATDGLVGDLAGLADDAPLRERPRALLIEALTATGRHAEALRVYDDFRRQLGDELGIEPSPELAARHAAVLAGGAATSTWSPPSRLPVPANELVGREALLSDVEASVPGHRLLTLVGPGGVGKTRLLIELGHRLVASGPDRSVVLCELAAADEGSAVDAVASALGIDARPGVPMVRRVADAVGDEPLVLLLDNCEHVLDAAAELVERLLASCPNATVVATSRERLRVAGEHLTRVPTLPIGADDGPAVRLFTERARAVVPDLEPDPDDLACIAEIVERLDGLPLAIELAAARLHTHDVREVAAGLDHRFSLLSSGYRTSTRHGSLAATVSWSFDLLDPFLQGVFADLSVFAGSFASSDAAAVGALDENRAADALAQLVERSLVMRAPGHRYVLLETLRAYAAEQLVTSGRVDAVAARHAHHQVAWAEAANRRLLEPGEPVLAEIDAALAELRTALGWLLGHGEVATAGRLVASMMDYGFMRLRLDVLAWAEQVAAADPADRSPLAARVWVVAAYAAWLGGDVGETAVRSERGRRIAEATGDPVPGDVWLSLGSVALFEGRLDDAATWYRRAVDTAPDPGKRLLAAGAELLALGYAGDPAVEPATDALLAEVGDAPTPYTAYIWYCAGEAELTRDVERARLRLVRALDLATATNASFVIGLAGATKASIDARSGDPVEAAEEYRRLIDHWRRAGVWSTQWTMLRSIAGLLARLGRDRDAAVLVGAVRATGEGHRIFGADEVALTELEAELRAGLGDDEYIAARREGAALDGDRAVEHVLRVL